MQLYKLKRNFYLIFVKVNLSFVDCNHEINVNDAT